MTYVPREGSKTAAAVDFLKEQGGQASDADICEAADIDRKNISPILQTAVEHGLLDRCEVGEGKGYRLRTARAAPSRAEEHARAPQVTRAIAARPTPVEIRNRIEPRPAAAAPDLLKPKAKTRANRPKPKQPAERAPARIAPPPPDGATFRCGVYSDGSMGLQGDFAIHAGGFTLDADQTSALVSYLRKVGVLERPA